MKNQVETSITNAEPEYEWGIMFHAPGGLHRVDWGYKDDPRTSGVIDEDGEIHIENDYREVLSVGKRLKSPEVWEHV